MQLRQKVTCETCQVWDGLLVFDIEVSHGQFDK